MLDKKLFEDFFGNDIERGKLVLFEYAAFEKYFLANKDIYRSAYGCINYYPYQYFDEISHHHIQLQLSFRVCKYLIPIFYYLPPYYYLITN